MATDPDRTRLAGRAAVGLGVAILLVSLNLRLPVTALGPVLEEIRADLGIGAGVAGVLTSVPVLVFALAGTLVPWLRRRLSLGASIAAAMVLVIAGTLVRPFGTAAVLLAGTVVIMVGIAVINVLLPVVVRSGFGGREGWVTGGYVASLQVGAAAGASLTVPLASALGGWPRALASWAVVGLVGLVAWLPAARGVSASGRRDAAVSRLRPAVLLRDRTTRNLTVFFGLQSMVAYIMMGWLPTVLRDEGMAASSAGAMVAVVTLVTIPVSLVLPGWLGTRPDQRLAPWFVVLPWWLAFAGLLVAPVRFAFVWAALLGIGVAGFPVTLALFGLRTASPSDTMQVSTFAQSIGYLVGLPGPLLAGVLADATGGWTVPLLVLCAVNLPILATGLVSGSPVTIGADLPEDTPASTSPG
ncbi:MFS transporter [Salsipaludibacter albus]|uniref:MFS transporter n=1 Tax=Salsipaludibacter albus TaxID=2849650 RepID=UPI001EE44320|nr:MFS transporter [Salsipaludibacter albus]